MSAHDKPPLAATLTPRELARHTGVSTDSLRHYETRGVLARPNRTIAGYRRYPAEAIARVQLIQRALVIGFSLDELARVLEERDRGGAPCQAVFRLVTDRLAQLDRQVAELTALRDDLTLLLGQWSARLAETPEGARAHLLDSLAGRPALERVRTGRTRDRRGPTRTPRQ